MNVQICRCADMQMKANVDRRESPFQSGQPVPPVPISSGTYSGGDLVVRQQFRSFNLKRSGSVYTNQ